MGRLNKIILIMGVITLFFHFAGLVTDSPARVLLTLLLNYEAIATTTFIAKIITMTTSLAAAGIAIGALIAGKPELAIKVPMLLFVVEVIYGWVAIIQKLAEVDNTFAIIVGAPLLLYFVWASMDWLFGSDT